MSDTSFAESATITWRSMYDHGRYKDFVAEQRMGHSGCSLLQVTQPAGCYPHEETNEVWIGLQVSGTGKADLDLGFGGFEGIIRPGNLLVRAPGRASRYQFDHGHTFLLAAVSTANLRDELRYHGLNTCSIKSIGSVILQDRHLANVLRAFWADSGSMGGDPDYSALVGEYLLHAVVARQAMTPVRKEGGLADWQIAKLNRFIDANLASPLSVSDLAAEVRLSVSRLFHAFPQTVGVSPYAYIRLRRAERAKELLLKTESSLEEIAASVGCAGASEFSRMFRSVAGVTPSSFRRNKGLAWQAIN